MSINKLRTGFTKYTDGDFLNKARYILECMTDNPDFINPIPPLDELRTAITKYGNDLLAAADFGHAEVASKNQSRKNLQQLLARLAMYVMFIANGKLTILTGSGYTLAKQPESLKITNPGNVTLSIGMSSGEMESKVKAVKTARTYLHQILDHEPDESSEWTSYSCSRCKFVFKNLTPGKKYWIRVAALGSGGQIAYSTVASQFSL